MCEQIKFGAKLICRPGDIALKSAGNGGCGVCGWMFNVQTLIYNKLTKYSRKVYSNSSKKGNKEMQRLNISQTRSKLNNSNQLGIGVHTRAIRVGALRVQKKAEEGMQILFYVLFCLN